jgi:hypothetical protein
MFLTLGPFGNSQNSSRRTVPGRCASLYASDRMLSLGRLCLYAVLILAASRSTAAQTPPPPVLLSEATSTRAIALESVTQTREPFAPASSIPWSADQRTRISLFAMNLALQPGEDASAVTAGAEDGEGRRYTLKVEYVGAVSGAESFIEVVLRLSDDLVEAGDVGDVLVWVAYGGQTSNRVRVGIGHVGGGPPDDAGAVPTQPLLISGSVISNNAGLEGVELTLDGGTRPETLKTTNDGSYFFIVAPFGSYTLTPQRAHYNFEPASRSFYGITNSESGVFFSASLRQTYTIFGQVHDETGTGLFNVTLRLTGDASFEPRTTTTDDSGQFSFFDVPAGFGYTVTPLDDGVATFQPETTGPLNDDILLSIKGTRHKYSIRGRVADDVGPVQGAMVTLEGYGLRAETDTAGRYSFDGLSAGTNYTVTVAAENFIFDQPSLSVFSLEGDTVLNFDARLHIVLSGRVTDPGGRGIFGIYIKVGGKQSGMTHTDANGNYSFAVTEAGDYTVTPLKEQGYYSLSPSSVALAGVKGARSANFTGSITSTVNPSYVLEFDGTPKSVDYSLFWPGEVDLGHFYWEFWAMPGEHAEATYMISDGYGGAHAILFGFANFSNSEPGRYQLLGDIWDGHALSYFSSDEGPAPGEWGHYAVGWDGQYIVTYFNGVPVGRTSWVGPRISPGPAGGGGRLFIGGSDHSNFVGRIAQVRGYENSNPREAGGAGSVYASFKPQTVFGLDGSLMSWYFRPADYVDDLSLGQNGEPHGGIVRGWTHGSFDPCLDCPRPEFVVDPTAPNFADPAHPGQPPAPVDSPTAVPAGAFVFDSFSRRNSTYALGGVGGLGSTEGGSAGTLVWRNAVPSGSPQPFGILNGRAVLLADNTAVTWVDAGAANNNLDIRVNRRPLVWGSGLDTGISFRVTDAENYFFAYTSESVDPAARALTVGYFSGGQRTDLVTEVEMPATWKTLRVVTTAAGLIEVYADDSKLYSMRNVFMSSSTGAGLYNSGPGLGLTNRWDNFTVFGVPKP